MGFYTKSAIGLALFFGALTAFSYALYEVLQIGTCASGGPYVSARPCPEGTATWILTMTASVFVGLIGGGIYAARGRPPNLDPDAPSGTVRRLAGTGLAFWSIFFTVTGAVALWSVIGPDAQPGPGSKLGGYIVGGTFLVMGGVPLIFIVLAWLSDRMGTSGADAAVTSTGASSFPAPAITRPSSFTPPAPVQQATPQDEDDDPLVRLEKLAKLRDDGVISSTEFELAKAKILADT